MDAGGTAFKSTGSGKNTSFSIRGRPMPVFLALKQTSLLCWDKLLLFLTWWFPWETLSHQLPQLLTASVPVRSTVQRPACSGSFVVFQLWHWENMSCQISALYTGLIPVITVFEGRMPVISCRRKVEITAHWQVLPSLPVTFHPSRALGFLRT